MNLHALMRPGGPWLHAAICSPADLSDAARSLQTATRAVRVVRGGKARTVAALYDEIAAALQFPLYFGENWDALNDCLGDLAWLAADAVVIFVADAARLLDQAKADDLARFYAIAEAAAKHKGPGFDLVLHAAPADQAALEARLKAAKVSPNTIRLVE